MHYAVGPNIASHGFYPKSNLYLVLLKIHQLAA